MKVLVIGGTRYFGKRLVHYLINEGHEVWVMSRGQVEDDFGAKVHRLKADRSSKVEMTHALGNLQFDVVVDQVCMNAQQALIATEVFAEKTSFYVMTSTMSVYDWGANLREDEVNPFLYQKKTPKNPMEEYAEGKRSAENVFAGQNSFAWAFARFPIVLGEDDYTLRLHGQVEKVKSGAPIYYPNLNARFSFISSEDAAKSLLWLIHGRREGIYNFASEDTLQLGELVGLIEKTTGKKAHLLSEPSEAAWSPFGIPSDWYLNVEKAKREGFQAKPLNEWLIPLVQKIS
ncbi:NAD-dependent epimerase/dehydratase family protein [Bdellovibrio bacteriovorus]|uniref:NAD-dependent epimerase/dehydratase family protein n=1 Tax=Bdellovibrio bacteriovorus TaxID=959 RepID=UPI0035A96FBC